MVKIERSIGGDSLSSGHWYVFMMWAYSISILILQTKKFLKCDWLRPVVFKPNLKYLHVKITASHML